MTTELDTVTANANDLDVRIFTATKALHAIARDPATPDNLTAAGRIELARAAGGALNLITEHDDDVEYQIAEAGLSAASVAHIIMQNLPKSYTEEKGWATSAEKTFWIEVGEVLGPDWVEAFRKTAMFMMKVREF